MRALEAPDAKADARAAAEARADAEAAAQDYVGAEFEDLQNELETWRMETEGEKDSKYSSVTSAFNETVNKLAALESIVQVRIKALRFVTGASIASAGAKVGAASGAKMDAAAGGEEGAADSGDKGNAVAFDKKKVDRFLKGVTGAVRDFCNCDAKATTDAKVRLLNAISSAATFQIDVLKGLSS